jgi:hypothetical protein
MAYKKKLTEELYFYLIQHHFLHLPGLGDFSLKRIAATIDAETRSLIPPNYTLQFAPSEIGTHRELFSYLAEKLNITEVDAIKWVTEFAMELKFLLNRDGFAPIELIGKLYLNDSGNLSLDAQPLHLNFLTQTVPSELNVENIKTVVSEEEDNEDFEIKTNEFAINEENEEVFEYNGWKKNVLILITIAIIIFIISRFTGNPSQLMGLQNSIQAKFPLLQHN